MIEMTRRDVYPEFGRTHRPGYLFFTRPRKGGAPAYGISYFTRADGEPVPGYEWFEPIHEGVVTGEDEGSEALGWPGPGRVLKCRLSDYFYDSNQIIVFRKPAFWTPEVGDRIAESARSREGMDYAEALLLGHAWRGSAMGRLMGKRVAIWVSRLAARGKMICSKHGVIAHRDGYADEVARKIGGVLTEDPDVVSPRRHFTCRRAFQDWKMGREAEVAIAALRRAHESAVSLSRQDGRTLWA